MILSIFQYLIGWTFEIQNLGAGHFSIYHSPLIFWAFELKKKYSNLLYVLFCKKMYTYTSFFKTSCLLLDSTVLWSLMKIKINVTTCIGSTNDVLRLTCSGEENNYRISKDSFRVLFHQWNIEGTYYKKESSMKKK